MFRHSAASLVLSLLLLPACSSGQGRTDIVAEAGSHEWTVEEAAALIAPDADLPARPEVVRAIADLWIDYTLLASAAAEDAAMGHIDVSPLVRQLVDERVIMSLRDSVIEVDSLPDAELRSRYDAEAAETLVRARHLLLRWPPNATQAQRDSVRRAMDDLRRRVTQESADFGALARSFSQDPTSASNGGDLGFVPLTQLVAPLQSVVGALEPGEVSEPIESQFGLHLIRVEDRRAPTFEEFRAGARTLAVARAESMYVAGLEAEATPEVAGHAAATVRRLAQDPRAELGRGDAIEPLVRYNGGEITAGEVLQYLQNQTPAARNQVAQSPDETIPTTILRALTQRELLLAAARRRGLSVRPEIEAGLVDAARGNLAEAARQLGLTGVTAESDEERAAAVEQAVNDLLHRLLSGEQREVTPLGAMSHVLRSQSEARVHEDGVAAVVRRVEADRSSPDSSAVE